MTSSPAGRNAVSDAQRAFHEAVETALVPLGRARTRLRFVARLRVRLADWLSRSSVLRVGDDEFSFDYHPSEARVSAVRYHGRTLDLERPETDDLLLAAYPLVLEGVASTVAEHWTATFDAPCPVVDRIESARQRLADALAAARTSATLDDLLGAIEAREREYVEFLLDVDAPTTRSTDTEAAALLADPVPEVVYRDRDLALLRRHRAGWVGWEHAFAEAFVVGTDDTPGGFFVHAVDATNLSTSASIDRATVLAALGIDRSLAIRTDVLTLDSGERVRVQGDLCFGRTSRRVPDGMVASDQLNLLVDNHLLVFGEAARVTGDTDRSDAVTVAVPDATTLHVVHDEHPQVDVGLRPGVYTVGLLPRGVQSPATRPQW